MDKLWKLELDSIKMLWFFIKLDGLGAMMLEKIKLCNMLNLFSDLVIALVI